LVKVIVAGSRRIATYELVQETLDSSPFKISTLLSGTAAGVDSLAEGWATEHEIPIERYPLDWKANKKNAPLIRNCEMSVAADAFIAIWDGYSRGTWGMIEVAAHYRLQVYIRTVDD
jgi:YspA, cpYpsA-related SLOG family